MCGILGIISKRNHVPIKIYEGLAYLQHRGQDSAGICNEYKDWLSSLLCNMSGSKQSR